MADVGQIMDALAAELQETLCGTANPLIEQLQVEPRMVLNPTPPAIDIYPAEIFTEALTYGIGNRQLNFVVRCRVSTADSEGGQDLLLSMMDPDASTSVMGCLEAADTLGGKIESLSVDNPSGFGVFPAAGGDNQNLIGCTWMVRVIP